MAGCGAVSLGRAWRYAGSQKTRAGLDSAGSSRPHLPQVRLQNQHVHIRPGLSGKSESEPRTKPAVRVDQKLGLFQR